MRLLLQHLLSVIWILLSVIPGMWHQLFKKAKPFTLPSMEGRTVIITGGNRGIGKETAKALALQGAHVIIASRDMGQAKAVAAEINLLVRQTKVEAMELDLASFASIRAFVSRFEAKGIPLHVLINNAGLMFGPKQKTVDGLEQQLAINHYGHFLLTVLLLPRLEETNGRIVVTSSAAHACGSMDFDDLNADHFYSPYTAYMQSKLANLLFMYELNRRIQHKGSNVTVNALHPGVVWSDLWRNTSPFMTAMVHSARFLYKTVKSGAKTTIFLAAHPSVQGVSGKYFIECEPVASSVDSYNREWQKKLWEVSVAVTGVDYHPL